MLFRSPKILDRIKFVDKIIFGKLNYNVQVSNYQDNKEFYEGCANMVINFCAEHGIKQHIKYGTQKRDNRKTEKIFKRPVSNEVLNFAV